MKKYLILILVSLLSLGSFAQEKPVKIVFDVTSGDVKVHESAVRHIKSMAQAYPNSQFELVVYSGGLDMVLSDKSSVAQDLKEMVQKPNISVAVCKQSLDKHNMTEAALIPGVKTVPDGILEIANKQQMGWSYIKEQ